MRYYIYISDAKIEMLLPQVPDAFQQKIAAEIGFDIKLLKGKLATERSTLDNRIARLEVIERHLTSQEKVGSVEKRVSWIHGEVLARTVTLGKGGVLFISHTPKLVLGLAGSVHHILGGVRPEAVTLPLSFLPRIIDELDDLFESRFERYPSLILEDLPERRAQGILSPSSVSQGFGAWNEILLDAWRLAKGPDQRIQFLAKRLASEVEHENEDYESATTLATPLYVALSD